MNQKNYPRVQGSLAWVPKKQFVYASQHPPALDAIGSKRISFNVNSFTQFDPLKCVVVGYVDETASITNDLLEAGDQQQTIKQGQFPKQLIQKDQQDLNRISINFQNNGVQVVRAGKKDHSKQFLVDNYETLGFCSHSPRDLFFCYHNSVYQFPAFNISRHQEMQAFQWIEKQLHQRGCPINQSWKSITKGYRYMNKQLEKSYESETDYFADAANLLKLGLDIIFLISTAGSKGCYNIFRKFMEDKYQGKVRVHSLQNFYKGFHIDTSIALVGYNKKVNKYIAFIDGYDEKSPTVMPAIFRGKNWALIQFNKYKPEFLCPQYVYVSDRIGMNFVMINSETAMISENQTQLAKILEFYGVSVLPQKITLSKVFGGGMHCITNDIHREDIHNFAKVLESPAQSLTKQELSGLFDPELLSFLQKQGDITEWVNICNRNKIFPCYLTDHLTQNEKEQMLARHQLQIYQYFNKQVQLKDQAKL